MVAALVAAALFVVSCGGPKGPLTIQYAYWGDQNEETTTTALLKVFMDKNPSVKVDGVRFGTNVEFNDKITTLAAAGTLPDVSTFYEPNVLTWGMSGKFVDLTDFYKKGAPKLDAIKFVTPDGKIVGISVANEIQVIWYNKKIFDAAKLPYPPAEASKAWTWDQFVDVAKKLTKDAKGRTPNDKGFDKNNIRTFGAWIQQWWMPWLTFAVSNGGGMTTPDGKKLILDDPATIDAIQKMADLINVSPREPDARDAADSHCRCKCSAERAGGNGHGRDMGPAEHRDHKGPAGARLRGRRSSLHEAAGDDVRRDARSGLQEHQAPQRGAQAPGFPHGSQQLPAPASERHLAAERKAVVYGPEPSAEVDRQSAASARVQDGRRGFCPQLLAPAPAVHRPDVRQDG